jgi:ribosome recycling factor
MMVERVFKDVEDKMEKSIEHLKKELNSIRTGRASASLLDGVTVDYYGQETPLNQAATISVPESRLITVQPWDPTLLEKLEKAILQSNLGLNPSNDGKILRINLPVLTEERRGQLAKMVKKIAEESKIAIRNVRREGNDSLKTMEKDKKVSQDDLHKAMDKIQKITDDYVKKVDAIIEAKEKEIMEG